MQKVRWTFPSVAFLVLLLVTGTAFAALVFPTLSGRVVDEAGILDTATRASITAKLEALEAKTTDQLVVVTLKSLQGTTIEDFGVQLGRAWKIGQKDKNNGILLIVAPNERKVRIEVGYGLEGTITDAVSRLIIETSILPRFKANDIPGGITRGVDDLIQALTGDASDYKDRAQHHTQQVETSPTTDTPRKKDSLWPIIIGVLVVIGIIMFCILVSGVLCQIILQMLLSVAFSGGSSSGSSGGGFSGGGGSFGGGGASGSW